MSGQQGQGALDRKMDEAATGGEVDLQEAAKAVNSGKVSAENQSTPQGETRVAYGDDKEPDDQPS